MIESFSVFPEIQSGFSSATDGTMAIVGGFENRQNYLATRGIDPHRTVHAGLSHGVGVAIVAHEDGGRIMADTDGLITTEANVCLAMTAADCLLISVYDPVRKVIGIVHAGSKGLAQNVVSIFLQKWESISPTDPRNMVVDVSPSICSEHYPVNTLDAQWFLAWPMALSLRPDGTHIDLRRIARAQLQAGGVVSSNISTSARCTFEDRELYSYRRDHPGESQLQVGYMMRRAE